MVASHFFCRVLVLLISSCFALQVPEVVGRRNCRFPSREKDATSCDPLYSPSVLYHHKPSLPPFWSYNWAYTAMALLEVPIVILIRTGHVGSTPPNTPKWQTLRRAFSKPWGLLPVLWSQAHKACCDYWRPRLSR